MMKVKEVKEMVEKLTQLARNLENLQALADGNLGSMPNKDDARAWSEETAEMAQLNSPLSYVFEAAKNVTTNEIERLNKLIDDAEIDL